MTRGRKIWRRTWKGLLFIVGFFVLLIIGLFIYLYSVARMFPPEVADKSSLEWKRTQLDSTAFTLNNSWFRKSRSGLYEMYVEGKPFERGVVYGKLAAELVQRQEDHFTEQIGKMIPSKTYQHFLKYLIGWFNRNMDKNVPEEYKEEIYGVSFAASEKYKFIGSSYQRIMNYHAAHDIGHALQSMALVGCTSFGTWNDRSEDSSLIIGRNFDFYVGDKFAEDKIVAFYRPDKGYGFMMITWGGFTGVVSGMNEQGLTVTINAAKSSIPSGSATPVSLVAREILQYAKNIDEAYAIAHKRKMFVSESFLIGSANDNRAAIIEKTPTELSLYDPKGNEISCANHFQSKTLGASDPNQQQLAESASPYRYQRLQELLQRNGKNSVAKTVAILRDQKGVKDTDIGMGNEKAVNQLIAHHSIVFEPKQLKVWVSTAPWQLGEFVAYDLKKVLAMKGLKADQEICDSALTIPADTFLLTEDYKRFVDFRRLKAAFMDKQPIDVERLVKDNPKYYHTYVIAGDYLFKKKDYKQAEKYYREALTREIATKAEKDHILQRIKLCGE
ncbi:C45 family peptidase [Chitinophaga niabensis]|uniref:Acyl-coenzyme A:6-aminopenicillanic acid acyl-transferase n=1 Tax=Chitinophaga niabensis TaxID=536979 RepID=A0A1N6GJZ2_9BACT|nr:C45 family peptidase [Chitinophaga niabensis]SIO07855.1 Acyl-coenzyme A:6-aminopenicillanic acid acyl-transferase [Chitinophaga niabensis]